MLDFIQLWSSFHVSTGWKNTWWVYLQDTACVFLSLSSGMAEWSWVVYTVLEVLVATACCFGNMLVVFAVCTGIRDSLREPTFCFLVSLAVADFLVGVAAVPLAVLLDGWASLIPDVCLLLSCVVLVLTQASVLSLLAIAVDRYLRLHTPLRWGYTLV